jgi:hypothetical protein
MDELHWSCTKLPSLTDKEVDDEIARCEANAEDQSIPINFVSSMLSLPEPPLVMEELVVLKVSFKQLERLFKRFIVCEMAYHQHLDTGTDSKCWHVGQLWRNYEAYQARINSVFCPAK